MPKFNFLTKRECSIRVDNVAIKLIIDCETSCEEDIVTMTLHKHSHAEIFTCEQGEVSINVKGEKITLFPGDSAIIPSGVMHLRSIEHPGARYNTLGIVCTECGGDSERDAFLQISSYISGEKPHIFRDKPEFCKAVDNALTTLNDENEFTMLLCFACEFCKLFDNSGMSTLKSEAKAENNAKNIDRLVKLDYLINTKFMANLSNKQIASELFISERQLARLVRDHYGATLHSLIINKRIETAAILLEKTEYSVESIALLVGFKSKTAFYSDFSKKFGLTPIEYRLKFKESEKR